ncbi:hypothetical protein M3231_15435 [Neobacillus mesonae]|nr:hypothetical protein [Neobacillus mesonae]
MKKFPVTAPDGREFRVSIHEAVDILDEIVVVKLYVKRKRFGFKRVYTGQYRSRPDGVYNHENVNFILIATYAVESLYELEEERREYKRQRERRKTAIKAFESWDGKIN